MTTSIRTLEVKDINRLIRLAEWQKVCAYAQSKYCMYIVSDYGSRRQSTTLSLLSRKLVLRVSGLVTIVPHMQHTETRRSFQFGVPLFCVSFTLNDIVLSAFALGDKRTISTAPSTSTSSSSSKTSLKTLSGSYATSYLRLSLT